MAKKASGHTPKKKSMQPIQRGGKNLARLDDTAAATVAYFWYCKPQNDPIPGVVTGSPYFVVDVSNSKKKIISVYLDAEQMHDVVEECRCISSQSLCDLAQRMVLSKIKKTDPRYIYWYYALREFHLDSISDSRRPSDLSSYIPWMVDQIISCSGLGYDEDNEEWMKTILGQFLEEVYYAEVAIKNGEYYIPVTYMDYDPEREIQESGTDVLRWETCKIRVGYKPPVEGIRKEAVWQLLAQITYKRYILEYFFNDDGELLATEHDDLEYGTEPAVSVSVANNKFVKLLEEIGYRLQESKG